jgi:hypothetical protein
MAKKQGIQVVSGYGARLRARLDAAGLTQTDLARAATLSRQTIANALADRVSTRTIKRIDDVLMTRAATRSAAGSTSGFSRRPRSDTWVTATDLDHWSDFRESQSELPRVIRRLALVTNPDIRHISFRTGEGVNLGGADGTIDAAAPTAFIPEGISVWEMGTGADPRRKADDDYNARTAAEGIASTSTRTFLFVTSRRWSGKDAWVASKKADGKWKDVRAIDADDLEAWLESAPSVHLWFSHEIGTAPVAALDFDRWWRDWQAATNPALSARFMLAGRDEEQKKILQWLASPASALGIQTESRDESIALFASILDGLPPDRREAMFGRTVIVQNEAAWRYLVATKSPLILIPSFDADVVIASALRTAHAVIVPLGIGDATGSGVVDVRPILREPAVKELEAGGVDRDRCWSLASLARRSMTAFRRTIAIAPTMRVPGWAEPGVARTLLPAMLVPRWNDGRAGDRRAISMLGQAYYDEIIGRIEEWSHGTDPALRRRLAVWYLVSPEDAFTQLRRFINEDDLARFATLALDVLGRVDARLELPHDKRWLSGIIQETPEFSDLIRASVASTLALLGARGDSPSVTGPADAVSGVAGRIVSDLLARANADFRLWQSLGDCFPALAEAAPDVFLGALESGLGRADQPLRKIFMDEKNDSFFVSSPHTGLLRALERLAWSADYLPRVVRVLGALDRIDPDGRLVNRPLRTLRSIFLPWLPQTSATVDERLAVLEEWADDQPDIVWKVLVSMLPEFHGIGEYTDSPRWREWKRDGPTNVPALDYSKCVVTAIAMLLHLVGTDGARWTQLISALPMLQPREHEAVLGVLSALDPDSILPADRKAIWDALRVIVADHRSSATAAWRMPPERTNAIATLLDQFAPTDTISKYGWLFCWHAKIPDGSATIENMQEYTQQLEERRDEAIRAVADDGGAASVIRIAALADDPQSVGWTAARLGVLITDEDALLRDHLADSDRKMAQFAFGYAGGRIYNIGEAAGREWVKSKFESTEETWSAKQRAEFLHVLQPDRTTWQLAASAGEDVERAYWQVKWTQFAYRIPADQALDATRTLIRFDNPFIAVELLGLHIKEVSDLDVIAEALEAALAAIMPDTVPGAMFADNVERLLDKLGANPDVDELRIGQLEWGYLPIVTRHDRTPNILTRVLVRDPQLFVDAVCMVYRRKNDGAEDGGEEEAGESDGRSSRAYSLLHAINILPGTGANGVTDSAALRAWVDGVLAKLSECDRLEIGTHQIGQMVGAIKVFDADGTWPCTAVRDLIDGLDSDDLNRGFAMGLYNSRGVTMRSPTAGGSLERGLAERYAGFATAVSHRWPRTAEVLRGIAAGYREEARREDQRVELEEDLGA